MTTAEMDKQITGGDLPKPFAETPPEERQHAMRAFLESVRNTDDATEALIAQGIDQMLEIIYSSRTPPQIYHPVNSDSGVA